MKIKELIEVPSFDDFRREIFEFAKKLLDPYTDDLADDITNLEGKEIFDAVWGPVEFNAGEILILDSPLIQRLRKIKQLGLASYVYCGADCSRFAHTIGVFFVANEMALIIQKRLKDRPENRDFRQLVRLGALFHDAGHMYYSHVSERFFGESEEFGRYEEIKQLKLDFCSAIDKNVGLHEIISVLLVNSPAVRRLLERVHPALDSLPSEDMDEITEYISCLILGQPNDPLMLPYSQIISGPVDADKCDYLKRDSHATNVPVAVDIFRLIHKLDVNRQPVPENLEDLEIWDCQGGEEVYYPAIKSSATEAMNQLVMARSSMFNSVYFHQKVRTAEAMLRDVIKELNHLGIDMATDFTDIMLMTDDVFGYYCYDILMKRDDKKHRQNLRHITDKLNRINFRRLFKRASALSKEDITAVSGEKQYEFEKILNLNDLDSFRKIEERTGAECDRIMKLLDKTSPVKYIFMIMEFPKMTLSDSMPEIIISYSNGTTKKASDVFQTATWVESKGSRHKELYLITDCENRELAFLAFQRALFGLYGVYLNDRASSYTKTPLDKIGKLKKDLLQRGYYDEALQLVSNLLMPSYIKRIKKIAKKFQTYEGADDCKVTEERISEYLKQFLRLDMGGKKCREFLDGVLLILESALFIDRKNFKESMERLLDQPDLGPDRCHLCPLGGSGDSASHMMYYFHDLEEGQKPKLHADLQEALRESSSGDTILFFDDGAYSGKQVQSILEEYMGAEERATPEHHVTALTGEEKVQLGQRKVALAYICFNEDSREAIMSRAEQLDIPLEKIVFMHGMRKKLFGADSGIFKSDEQRDAVREIMERVGHDILYSAKSVHGVLKEGWTEERVGRGALGYNDAQQAVILKSSVPTYTLTPLWLSHGTFMGEEWMPLFRRTDKSSNP